MKLHQKCYGKRYCVFAKRIDGKAWTDWTQSDDLSVALEQVAEVRALGFLGKVKDRKEQKIITSD